MNLDKTSWDSVTAPGRQLLNVGFGSDVSIAELAETVAGVVGYTGTIAYDHTKPDGTPRKLIDTSRLLSLGWKPQVELLQGLSHAYGDFLASSTALKAA
jgi:GDP-L-fucose synthase